VHAENNPLNFLRDDISKRATAAADNDKQLELILIARVREIFIAQLCSDIDAVAVKINLHAAKKKISRSRAAFDDVTT
jgi:hypothetical protein